MTASELLRRQLAEYPKYHQSRFNLWIHIVLVPVFLAGNLEVFTVVDGIERRLYYLGAGDNCPWRHVDGTKSTGPSKKTRASKGPSPAFTSEWTCPPGCTM